MRTVETVNFHVHISLLHIIFQPNVSYKYMYINKLAIWFSCENSIFKSLS